MKGAAGPARVVIAGGNGMLGRHLTSRLQQQGHHVSWLVRRRQLDIPSGVGVLHWDVDKGVTDDAPKETTHAVFLAGFPLAEGRLDEPHKAKCWTSRVDGARLFRKALAHSNLQAFVGASAVGYYGWNEEANVVFSEESPAGDDWASRLVAEWERQYQGYPCRTVMVRLAPVLSKDGGAYPKLRFPASLGASAALGSGTQILPWIHQDDAAAIFEEALFNSQWSGVVNAVAPEMPMNSEFTAALARSIGRPYVLPNIPSFVAKLLFGNVADMLLHGNPISNGALQRYGFSYRYPSLQSALAALAKD